MRRRRLVPWPAVPWPAVRAIAGVAFDTLAAVDAALLLLDLEMAYGLEHNLPGTWVQHNLLAKGSVEHRGLRMSYGQRQCCQTQKDLRQWIIFRPTSTTS